MAFSNVVGDLSDYLKYLAISIMILSTLSFFINSLGALAIIKTKEAFNDTEVSI